MSLPSSPSVESLVLPPPMAPPSPTMSATSDYIPAPPPAARPRTTDLPRVAVIGSGLAGLATAYLLRREGAEVFIIEKAPRLGFHAWSIELDKTSDDGSPPNYSQQCKRAALQLPPATASAGAPAPTLSPTLSPTTSPTCSLLTPPRSPAVSNGYIPPRPRSVNEQTAAVDVPMRSFQGGYYPLLIALYRHIGLPFKPMRFTFSFSSLLVERSGACSDRPKAEKTETYMIHSGSSGASRPALPAAAWRSPFAFVRAITALVATAICYVVMVATCFLNWHGLLHPLHGKGRDASFRQVVDEVAGALERPLRLLPPTPLGRAFKAFAADIVLPLFSAVGTMTADDVWSTPAEHILDYIHAGVGTSHYALAEGCSARDVARLLAEPVRAQSPDHVRLGTTIFAMRYRNGDGRRTVVVTLDGGEELEVDRVVIATQASGARALLGTLEPGLVTQGEKAEAKRVARMRTALGDVMYRDTIVVTHTDRGVLPRDDADLRDINLLQPIVDADAPILSPVPSLSPCSSAFSTPSPPASPCPSPSLRGVPPPALPTTPYFDPTPAEIYTMSTHLVRPDTATHPLVLQTTNPVIPVDPASVLGVARLERALPLRSARTLACLHPTVKGVQPERLVFLAGSYAYPGIPLLEGCVGSARRVVEEMCGVARFPAVGGVDWDAGRGGPLGRLWRWRAVGRGGYA